MSTTPTAIPTEAAPTVTALQPASTGRRVVAWLIDIVIVAALVGVVYLVGLIKINGCDTWDPATQEFGGSCPFESTREVTRSDGSVDLVYVLDSGRELPADHPTVKTVLLGTRIVDPPSAGTYLVGLGYVLVVYVVVQGLAGWTPGKLLAGVRLAREDGRSAGIPGAFVRWVVIDGGIGLFGVVMGLVGAWWPLRLLAADAALLLVGGVVALAMGGRRPGDAVAGTLVVDEAALALRKASTSASTSAAPPAATPVGVPAGPPFASSDPTGPDPATGPTPWAAAGTEHGAGAGTPAGAAAAATFAAGRAGPAEPLDQPPVTDPTDPATTPTPLPQWPGSPPTAQPPAAEPSTTGSAPPSTATPLGASVGAAPSALRPTPAADPTDTAADPTGDTLAEAPAVAPAETSALIAAAGDPAVDEPVPTAEEPSATEQAPADASSTTQPEPETEPEPEPGAEPEPDALVPTSVTPSGSPEAASPTGSPSDTSASEAAADRPVRQPEWDEARRAYIFWDDSRQEWLQYFDDSQSWGPITRA